MPGTCVKYAASIHCLYNIKFEFKKSGNGIKRGKGV